MILTLDENSCQKRRDRLGGMFAVSRFQAGDEFAAQAQPVVDFWNQCSGCLSVELVRNLDDPNLWALISRWVNVGAYRRSFSGYEAKMILTPVLSRAIDEPSAYLDPDELGANQPRIS